MIIECKSCLKTFEVDNRAIPESGRMVQCGFCSSKWFQKKISKIDKPLTKNKRTTGGKKQKGPDGKTYKFMGKQWAEYLPSGKVGMIAKKEIALELNELAGIKANTDINPSAVKGYKALKKNKSDSDHIKGIGFFGYIFLLMLLTISGIGVLETFKKELLYYFPASNYIFETLDNMLILIKDFIKSY